MREKKHIFGKKFKNWFGDWTKSKNFRSYNVDDVDALMQKYPSELPNKFYHHSTVNYGGVKYDSREGKKNKLHIIGRLTTDKIDALVVENPDSSNEISHITLATAKGIKPFACNEELKLHKDEIQPLDDYVYTTFSSNIDPNSSKVVDENGEPMVVYHGTKGDFNTFKSGEKGTRYVMGVPYDVESQGFFFTTDKNDAIEYAHQQNKGNGKDRVIEAYLDMKSCMYQYALGNLKANRISKNVGCNSARQR